MMEYVKYYAHMLRSMIELGLKIERLGVCYALLLI